MSKIEPKYGKNEKVEFVLKDDSVKSGYSHHCGYCKRTYERKRLFRKAEMLYDIVEASPEDRLLWHGIPETDILGIVEQKAKELPLKDFKGAKTFKDLKNLKELKQ